MQFQSTNTPASGIVFSLTTTDKWNGSQIKEAARNIRLTYDGSALVAKPMQAGKSRFKRGIGRTAEHAGRQGGVTSASPFDALPGKPEGRGSHFAMPRWVAAGVWRRQGHAATGHTAQTKIRRPCA